MVVTLLPYTVPFSTLVSPPKDIVSLFISVCCLRRFFERLVFVVSGDWYSLMNSQPVLTAPLSSVIDLPILGSLSS